jgi:two-component system, OmpR family, sensor histidine kinase MtrB
VASAVVSALIAATLSLVTYVWVRDYLLDQRDEAALREATANARTVREVVRAASTSFDELLRSLRSEQGSVILIRSSDAWFTSSIGLGPDTLPPSLLGALDDGAASRMRFETNGTARLAVAVPIPAADVAYVEVFPLNTIDSTLERLGIILAVGSLLVGVAGAGVGTWASRRALRPLTATSRAAALLAEGQLDARLPHDPDPDLDRLIGAFNEMAEALGERIAREARFTSDVSHELRTPVAAMRAAADVLLRRRDELSGRGREALELLSDEVDEFDKLVTDLLEISRIDAGVEQVSAESVVLPDFLVRVARQHESDHVDIDVDPRLSDEVWVDKRHLERIVSNLLRNAKVHAGGAIRIGLSGVPPVVVLEVDDAGPGVPIEERLRIFERFARSDDARQRPGSGLGLAIAAEHARLLGGSLTVVDRPGGGARFVLTFRVARA